ncbi:MAG TPA: DinB family protein [Ktedonobacterales bacterium]|nr:DinB family protein [Ktedonobacterales bacterium]
MNLSEWFRYQLRASGDGFIWAIEQLPEERRYLAPPRHPDDWSAARHAFHMFYYDQHFSLASIHQWLGGPCPSLDDLHEGDDWAARLGNDTSRVLEQFRAVRAEQIALLSQFDDQGWHEARETKFWGTVPLQWVVTKTYQHTAEHIHDVLRMALFWDRTLLRLQAEQESSAGPEG